MNPTAAAIAAIKGQVTDWAPSDAAIAAALNAQLVANPLPQAQVPRVMYESQLSALLTDPNNGSLAKLLNWPNFGLVEADINANNNVGVGLWAGKLELLGILTAAEASAVIAYATQPVPDPSYAAQVPWPVANLGRLVDAGDVAAARAS